MRRAPHTQVSGNTPSVWLHLSYAMWPDPEPGKKASGYFAVPAYPGPDKTMVLKGEIVNDGNTKASAARAAPPAFACIPEAARLPLAPRLRLTGPAGPRSTPSPRPRSPRAWSCRCGRPATTTTGGATPASRPPRRPTRRSP
jgi:hypothetical protein